MKKGILIVNSFLNTNKFNEIYKWLSSSAAHHNIKLDVMTNAEFLVDVSAGEIVPDVPACDFVLFWDKDVALARALEKKGLRLYNSADAIAVCDNKALTFETILARGGAEIVNEIRMPKTYRIPMTFSGVGYTNTEFLDLFEKEFGYPYVIKECCGSFGAQVYLITDRKKAIKILSGTNGRECIAQEYIKASYGRDVRIHTVGERVVTSMMRYNENDFRANITNGGSMKEYTPTLEQEELALKVARLLKLDFAGIDIMFGKDEEPVLCEVNSNAHFRNIFDCTGVNVADAIMEHIKNS